MPLSKTVCQLLWGVRRQEIDECTQLTLATLKSLASLGYSIFIRRGPSRADPSRVIEMTPVHIRQLLLKGVNRTDMGREPMPELGFSMSAYSGGKSEDSYVLTVHCGCYSEPVGNCVLFELPPLGAYSFAQSEASARRMIYSLISIWNPDSAILCEDNIDFTGSRIPCPEAKIYETYSRGHTTQRH